MMVGIGVIGTGYWGKNHVRVFKELMFDGLIDTVKICDINEHRVKELSGYFKVEYTTDYVELIDDPGINAVSVVTPSSTHYKIAKEFLENGKDVFMEKPMTMESTEAKKLVEIADAEMRIIMVGHIFRYHPAVCELKMKLDRGEFGKIYFIISNRFAFGAPRRDMGVIYALGIHEVDMFCYLLNVKYPKDITALAGAYLQPNIEEVASIILSFDDHVMGYAMESWLVPVYGKKRELVLIGSEKCAKIDYLKSQELEIFDIRIKSEKVKDNLLFSVENTQSYKIPIEYKEPLREELTHFIRCIRSRSKPLSDGEVGMRAVEMAEAAIRSAGLRRTIEFK
jgi:UDP-N-acetylglucosamine 3-dehydrogenase